MLPLTFRVFSTLAVFLCLVWTTRAQDILVQHSFTNGASPLNGTNATSGLLQTGSLKWVAKPAISANGQISLSNTTAATNGCAYLDLGSNAITMGHPTDIYELDVVLNNTTDTNASKYSQLTAGFWSANPGTNSYHGNGGCSWFYWWGDGEMSASTGPGQTLDIWPKNAGIPSSSGFKTFRFVLTMTNATLSNNTVAFYNGTNQLGSTVHFSGDEGFRYLGIGACAAGTNQTASGIVQSIALKKLDAPLFTASTSSIGLLGSISGLQITGTIAGAATDPQGYAISYSIVSGPAWLSMGADGTFSGTPGAGDAGVNTWTIKADDGYGGSSLTTITTTVFLPTVVSSTSWSYLSGDAPTFASAAQYAGLYALAGTNIEISRIPQTSTNPITTATNVITAAAMQSLLPGAQINGMAFTASGRQLFISAHGSSADAVLAYNMGTQQLRTFVAGLTLTGSTRKLGIAHYAGNLYVGTALGQILSFTAPLNALTGTNSASVSFTGSDAGQPVVAMSVDVQGKMIYVASANNLYRLDPSSMTLTQIASLSGITSISFGRTYGAVGQGGLLILQDTGTQRMVYVAYTADLQAGGGSVPLHAYYGTASAITDIAATACGRLLTAQVSPQILSDTRDTRMTFNQWMSDEFDQYTLMAKSCCWQDSGSLPGMIANSDVAAGTTRKQSLLTENAAIFGDQLILADKIKGDPESQKLVRQIITRYSTLACNADGLLWPFFDCTSGAWIQFGEGRAQPYSTKEMVAFAIRARSYYPNDPDIVNAANTIIGRLKNLRDYVQEGGGLAFGETWGAAYNHITVGPYQECEPYAEEAAAIEPRCENAYLDYWRYLSNLPTDNFLPGEPMISHTREIPFMRGVDTTLIQFCRQDPSWTQEFRNYYALFAGWTDDNSPGHLTVFGTGQEPATNVPNSSGIYPSTYNADNYTNHPGTCNSFPALISMGLLGDTVPVVGAYFAYRDGQRQLMQGSANYPNPNLLMRISYDNPAWVSPGLGPNDCGYGGFALGGLISPGSIESTLAKSTYVPPTLTTAGNGDMTIAFSAIVPRQVLATADGTNWDSLGFQYSPVTVSASTGYTNLKVQGAEGELLALTNQSFNQGLLGWTYTGSMTPSISSSFGLYSNCVVLTATGSGQSATNVLEQNVDVSGDLDGTLYLVRAIGKTPDTVNGQAFLRVQWYAGTNFISEQDSNVLNNSAKRMNYSLSAIKPAGATTMRIGLVAQPGNPLGGAQERYGFDEISVVLMGAEQTFTNSGFELGNLTGWTATNSTGMTASVVQDSRLGGSYALSMTAAQTATSGSEASVTHPYDISTDPIGTHYLLEYDVLTANLQGSTVRTTVTIPGGAYVSTNNTWVDMVANFDKYGHSNSVTKLSAGLKKAYTNDTTLNFQIRLHRDNRASVTASEQVLVDNVRLFKTPPNTAAPAVTTQGTPYSWLNSNNLVTNGYYESAAQTDVTGDGFAAWQKYIAGTNPNDPTSTFQASSVQYQPSTGSFVVTWNSVAGKNYTIESATNLTTPSWTPVFTSIAATPPQNTQTVSVGSNPTVFFRVRVGP